MRVEVPDDNGDRRDGCLTVLIAIFVVIFLAAIIASVLSP